MNTISGSRPMPVSQSGDGGASSKILEKAKAMGVPDDIIKQGTAAIKAWAKENGKIPSGGMGQGKQAQKSQGTRAEDTLLKELEKSGIAYEEFLDATKNGPDATKLLFQKNNFSIDISV